MVIGVPTVPVLYGILVVFAAYSMRAGYRGARVFLTVLWAPSLISPITIPLMMIASGTYSVLFLLALGIGAIPCAAVFLMWQPEVTEATSNADATLRGDRRGDPHANRRSGHRQRHACHRTAHEVAPRGGIRPAAPRRKGVQRMVFAAAMYRLDSGRNDSTTPTTPHTALM